MKHILILGGSYAGISTAHRLLKQASKVEPFKITLVTPNTHLYWNMASPRGIIPGQTPDNKLFQPIADGFSNYSVAQFEFILGAAKSIDIEDKSVEIQAKDGSKRMISFDFLILTTGSRTKEITPFKMLDTTEETMDALHDFQAKVKEAKTIVIAGAGFTGVETAGELGYAYGKGKNIIILASGDTILEGAPEPVSKLATAELQNLNVTTRFNTKVSAVTNSKSDDRATLTLSSGDKLVADLYIPTFGLKPNTSYMPSQYLNNQGYIIVDEFFRLKGVENVFAIGDCSAFENSQFVTCDRQSIHLSKNVVLILSRKAPLPYYPATKPFMGLQIGPKAGTGHYGSWKIPSFIIIWARKTLFIENLGKTVDGSLF